MAEDELSIGAAAELLGVSVGRLRRASDDGILTSSVTAGGHRRYDRQTLIREWNVYRSSTLGRGSAGLIHAPQWRGTYPIAGLAEDHVWGDLRGAITPLRELSDLARQVLGYAVTEMVNNAIDHSGGTNATVSLYLDDPVATIVVADDGVGAFARLADSLGLARPDEALIELTKGKRTSAPDRHSGEGIYFTSKAVDYFQLDANGLSVAFDNLRDDIATGGSEAAGTTVTLRQDLDTPRSLVALFDAYTDEGTFDRSVPRISLAALDGEFLSRSEAKRLTAGLEKFTRVELDFTGVPLVGQGFADEIFRVWHREHPEIRLDVIGANRGVALMIDRVNR